MPRVYGTRGDRHVGRAMIPIKHLSYSSITDIEWCLRTTYEKRVGPNRIPEIPEARRDSGSLAHKMIELAIRAIARQETLHDELLHRRIPAAALWQSPTSHASVNEDAYAVYRRWLRDFTVRAEDIFAVEREGECWIEGVPVPLIGRDDLVTVTTDDEGELYIADDWKTGWAATVTSDHELQGDLAGLRFVAEYPGKRFASRVGFPRLGQYSELRYLTPERKEAAENRVRLAWATLVEADERKDWPATPGEGCKFCPVVVSCAERGLVEQAGMIVTSQDSAERALRYRILFSEASKRLTAPLQGWVRDNGAVTVGRATAGYNASETTKITDVHAALERLTPDERKSLAPAMTLDKRVAAVKHLHDDPRIADLIATKIGKPRFAVKGTSADLDAEGGDELEGEE